MRFDFWVSSGYGLIRQRSTETAIYHPEVWRDGRWKEGSSYVVDAITGMGEDPYSSGGFAKPLPQAEAAEYAAKHGVDLFADPAPKAKR